MNRLQCYLAFVLGAVGGIAGWAAMDRHAQSFTGEFHYAACVEHLNCGNCLLGWKEDVECASGWACVAYRNPGGYGGDFKVCTPADDADHWCNSGVPGQTIYTCGQGFYQRCACRDANGDCPPTVRCDCNWVMPTGPMQSFTINSVCY